MSNIEAVFFDIDGVLFDRERAEFETLMAILSKYCLLIDDGHLCSELFELWKECNGLVWKKVAASEFSAEYAKIYRWILLFQRLGFKINPKFARKISDEYYFRACNRQYLVQGAKNLLDQLKSMEIPLAIITNGFEDVQRSKLISSGIDMYFDNIITESQSGFRKPDIRMFLYALQSMRSVANRVIYVGNSLEDDIMPACSLGIKSIWFDCNRELSFQDNSCSASIASTLSDVTKIIKEFHNNSMRTESEF